jgi:hypothetical protein
VNVRQFRDALGEVRDRLGDLAMEADAEEWVSTFDALIDAEDCVAEIIRNLPAEE